MNSIQTSASLGPPLSNRPARTSFATPPPTDLSCKGKAKAKADIGSCAVLKHHETVEIAPAKELFKFLDSSPPNHQKITSEKFKFLSTVFFASWQEVLNHEGM